MCGKVSPLRPQRAVNAVDLVEDLLAKPVASVSSPKDGAVTTWSCNPIISTYMENEPVGLFLPICASIVILMALPMVAS